MNTEKERKLQIRVTELENSNKSLRQNLLDTINDLKSTEKENELIFADKLKLLKQLGQNIEENPKVEVMEIRSEDKEEEGSFEDYELERKEKLDREIEGDNDLFKENSDLVNHSDSIINKYNKIIKKNLENSKQQLSESSQSFVKHKQSSSLHKIIEDKREEDISKQSLEFIAKSQREKIGRYEEAKM